MRLAVKTYEPQNKPWWTVGNCRVGIFLPDANQGGGGSKGLGLPAARLLLGQLKVALCLKERRWQARGRAAHFEVNGLWFREVHLQDGQPTVRKHDGCRNGRVAPNPPMMPPGGK